LGGIIGEMTGGGEAGKTKKAETARGSRLSFTAALLLHRRQG
jgi:hypothetical protein